MDKKIKRMERRMLSTVRGSKKWQRIITVLSCLVVFVTTYALILPVITMTRPTYCGKQEHTHSEECYKSELVCQLPGDPDHQHTSECYETVTELQCTKDEHLGHEHTEACVETETYLTCGYEQESKEHTHTDYCYFPDTKYVCGQEAGQGPTHTEECYTTEVKLICKIHVHDASCSVRNTTCDLQAHTHTEECYEVPDESESQNPELWEEKLPELTGHWAKDLLAAVQSQMSYAESIVDVDESGNGRSIYGTDYGVPYANWDAAFVSWCLNHLMIPDAPSEEVTEFFPRNMNTVNWTDDLKAAGKFYEGKEGLVPRAGDLMFFSVDAGRQLKRVAVVVDTLYDEEGKLTQVRAIMGDCENKVDDIWWNVGALTIQGWSRLPVNPDHLELYTEDELTASEIPQVPEEEGHEQDEPSEVLDKMEALRSWSEPIGAIADVRKSAPMKRRSAMLMAENGDPTPDGSPLLLADSRYSDHKAGYIVDQLIEWRLPTKPGEQEDTWKAFSPSVPIPANAEIRRYVSFINVDTAILQASGNQLYYEAESILVDFRASGVIRSEDGEIVGEISAYYDDTTKKNRVLLDFTQGAAWIAGLDAPLESAFYYQGKLDLSQIQNSEDGKIKLAGIDIVIPNAQDAYAEFAAVNLDKSSSETLIKDGNNYYMEYTLKVTAGEYGSPDVKVVDTVSAGNTEGYVGVTAEKITPNGPAAEHPLETITSGTGTATPVAGLVSLDGGSMVWEIGDMAPGEVRTLTYRVKVKDSYIGIPHTNDAIDNSATLYSKTYERGTETTTYSPKAGADILKTATETETIEREVNGETHRFYQVTYGVQIHAKADNSYPLKDLKVYDVPNAVTNGSGSVRLVEDSVLLNGETLPKFDHESNPRMKTNSSAFDVFVGDFEPNETKTLTYKLEMDVTDAEQNNGRVGIYNVANLYSKEDAGNVNLDTDDETSIQSHNTWVQKTSGSQTSTTTSVTFPENAKVYDATQGHSASTIMLPEVDLTAEENKGYSIPAGAYAYTVKINQTGEWDVTAANWQDQIQENALTNRRYLQFLEYVRVDVYDKLINPETGEPEEGEVRDTIWVKIDKQWQFAFTGKQIGLDGSNAYKLTYYAEAIIPDNVSYGTANADNQFGLSGNVIGPGGQIINLNVSQTVRVQAKEPGVNKPKKVAWYYDSQDDAFKEYHRLEGENVHNGALYWVIKLSGNRIPNQMAFQESTRLGGWNNYLRNSESLLGFYIVKSESGSDDSTNADEFINRFHSYQEFKNAFDSHDPDIRVVPEALYTADWTAYWDHRTHAQNEPCTHGEHYDLTLTFTQDYTIGAGEALYLLVRTDPITMPGNGQSTDYNNKCNYYNPSMGDVSNWPNTEATQPIVGPTGSLNKEPGGVFTVKNGAKTTVSGSDSLVDVIKHNWGTQWTDEWQGVANYLYEDGTYVTWTLSVNDRGKSEGEYDIIDQLPAGVELCYVRMSNCANNFNVSGSNVKEWNAYYASAPGYNNMPVDRQMPQGGWNLNSQSGNPQYVAINPDKGWGFTYTAEKQEWVTEGFTPMRTAAQTTNTGGGVYTDDQRTASVYYVKGNENDGTQELRIHLPYVQRDKRAEFQVVCKVTDEGQSELLFGDLVMNNQSSMFDAFGKKVDSDGAQIKIGGGNVDKTLLTTGKYNDSGKLTSTTYPYRVVINNDAIRMDSTHEGGYISIPFVDRMTGNMSIDLSSLRIYDLPAASDTDPTARDTDNYNTVAFDANLIYFGGSYTDKAVFVGRPWYVAPDAPEHAAKIGALVGNLKGDNIKISSRPAVDSTTGGPITGADGSPMHEIVIENLPDSKRLVIAYSVSVKLTEGNKLIFNNKAFWDGHEENQGGESEKVEKDYEADAVATTSDNGAVHITKYDTENYAKRLPGAVFGLYRAEYKLATAGNVILVDSDDIETVLTQDEIIAKHITAVYEGTDFSVNSKDRELKVKRSTDENNTLLEVYATNSLGQEAWLTPDVAERAGNTLHHKYDTHPDGSLKPCVKGLLAAGCTDANGSLSYGFSAQDLGTHYKVENGQIVTDASGAPEVLPVEQYVDDRIRFNKVYCIKELAPPTVDGAEYELDEKEYFFVVPNHMYDGVGLNYFYHDVWPDEVHICTRTEMGEITYMHDAPNTKKTIHITKDFAGSISAARPGIYTFGIWDHAVTENDGTMLGSVSITYDAEDFAWMAQKNDKVFAFSETSTGWRGVCLDENDPQPDWNVTELPTDASYGLRPDRVKEAAFPAVLNYGNYYIYELTGSGKPIQSSGVLGNGYTYSPVFSGPSKGTGANEVVYSADQNQITATNWGYSIELVKNFRNLEGDLLENGISGSYRFGLWNSRDIGEDGLPKPDATRLKVEVLTWENSDTAASKSITFSGLDPGESYHIFELDLSGAPITADNTGSLGGKEFIVHYNNASGGVGNSASPVAGKEIQIIATNTAVVKLPESGGVGTTTFTLTGITLMSLATLAYLAMKRKRA